MQVFLPTLKKKPKREFNPNASFGVLTMGQLGASEEVYFGAEEDDDQGAGVTDWMAAQEERSRVVLCKAIVDQLLRRLHRAERRLAYWTGILDAEPLEEFKRQFRARVATERETVDELRSQLARRAAAK
ncbi:MAG: hypothetical protein WC977_01950 [Anaerovoracaceae bacterium]